MATDVKPNSEKTWQNGGLKQGDNLMLCKVIWSAESLLTNYFNEVIFVFIEIAITYCYQFVYDFYFL